MKSDPEEVKVPVEEAFVLICEKCGKKLTSKDDENPSRQLHQFIKQKIKEEFPKRRYRPIVGSCQDICPNGKIAFSILPMSKDAAFGSHAKSYVIDPPSSAEDFPEMWKKIKKLLQ